MKVHICCKPEFADDQGGDWLHDTTDEPFHTYVANARKNGGIFIRGKSVQFIPWESIIRITFDQGD